MNDSGKNVLIIAFTVILIAILAGVGYWFTRGTDAEAGAKKVVQDTTPTLVKETNTPDEGYVATAWLEYTNKEHGYSFEYPSHWQVKESETGPQVELLNYDGHRRLSLYDDAAMGCEAPVTGNEESTNLKIGSTSTSISKNCNQSWGFLQLKPQKGEAIITILPGDFLGTPDEDEARKVLETIKGLTLVAR